MICSVLQPNLPCLFVEGVPAYPENVQIKTLITKKKEFSEFQGNFTIQEDKKYFGRPVWKNIDTGKYLLYSGKLLSVPPSLKR